MAIFIPVIKSVYLKLFLLPITQANFSPISLVAW